MPQRRRPRDREPDANARYQLAHRAMWDWLVSGKMPELEKTDAQLLLAASTRVPDGKMVTDLSLHQDYLQAMRCDRSTLTRAHDRLIGLGRLVLEEGGQGSKYLRYRLPDLAAPLLVAAGARSMNAVLRGDGSSAGLSQDQSSRKLHEVGRSPNDQSSRKLHEVGPDADQSSRKLHEVGPDADRDTFFLTEERRERSPQPHLPDADLRQEARKWYERFVAAYTEQVGELYLPDREDIEMVCDLLFAGATPAALDTYASVILTLTPAHRQPYCRCNRCWIANSDDKGIRLLRHCLLKNPKLKRFLDHEIGRRQSPASAPTRTAPTLDEDSLRAQNEAVMREALRALHSATKGTS